RKPTFVRPHRRRVHFAAARRWGWGPRPSSEPISLVRPAVRLASFESWPNPIRPGRADFRIRPATYSVRSPLFPNPPPKQTLRAPDEPTVHGEFGMVHHRFRLHDDGNLGEIDLGIGNFFESQLR